MLYMYTMLPPESYKKTTFLSSPVIIISLGLSFLPFLVVIWKILLCIYILPSFVVNMQKYVYFDTMQYLNWVDRAISPFFIVSVLISSSENMGMGFPTLIFSKAAVFL